MHEIRVSTCKILYIFPLSFVLMWRNSNNGNSENKTFIVQNVQNNFKDLLGQGVCKCKWKICTLCRLLFCDWWIFTYSKYLPQCCTTWTSWSVCLSSFLLFFFLWLYWTRPVKEYGTRSLFYIIVLVFLRMTGVIVAFVSFLTECQGLWT